MDAPTPLPPDLDNRGSLLPSLLLAPAAFLWLWVLPVGLMLLLNLQGYWIVAGNMDADQQRRALLLGLGGAADLFAGLAFHWVARQRERRGLHTTPWTVTWSIAAVVIQVGYLWAAVAGVDDILPRSVTAWIYPAERFMSVQFSFAMLPLFWGILVVSCIRTAGNAFKAAALGLGFAVGAPVALYVLCLIVAKVDRGWAVAWIVVATVIVLLGLLMFYGIVRVTMIVLSGLRRDGQLGERVAIGLFALVLPIGGLLLNRSIPFPVDFQATEVYVLACGNAAILFFASFQSARWPRLSFALLWATFPFSLYYFVVFLPYAPLSILALVALGAGFLVLTPTLLFILHVHLLNQARRSSVFAGRKWTRGVVALASCAILPAFFTVRGLADKVALQAALDYVYSPTLPAGDVAYAPSTGNLRRALQSHRDYKDGIYYPFLSDYYSWLVFDGLVLPDAKLARLEEIFFGRSHADEEAEAARRRAAFFRINRAVRDRSLMPRVRPAPRTVEIADLTTRVRSDGGQDSTVTLALTLRNTATQPAEYMQALPLPTGVYVSGFRLHINGVTVPGRIFEKKTALWVYTMIRDADRRDPGVLFYNSPNEAELRVYPVTREHPTVVEIDLLVPNPIAAENPPGSLADPVAIIERLGRLTSPQLASSAQGVLVAGLDGRAIPVVEREPYLHVIVDRSKDRGFDGDLSAALRALAQKFPAARQARLTVANYEAADVVTALTPLSALVANPPDIRGRLPLAGGFFADLAVAHAIRQHRDEELDHPPASGRTPPRPIFVILSRKAELRGLELSLTSHWLDLLPGFELDEFDASGALIRHRSGHAAVPLLRLGDRLRPVESGRPTWFEATDDRATLQYFDPAKRDWRPLANVHRTDESSAWSQAVSLQLEAEDYARRPGGAEVALPALVKKSRTSGILLPVTSYIVVENSAQWRMLELSERTKLGQNSALAFLETPAPPALYVGLGFLVWLAFRHRRKLRAWVSPAQP